MLLAIGRWPRWWEWIAPEQSPMTFFQAGFLLLAATLALLHAAAERLAGTMAGARRWAIVAAGFAALMLDERFALHERLRDGYLASTGLRLPWGGPGDWVLLLAALVGLALLPLLLRGLRHDRFAYRLCVAGVALAAAAVAADTVDVTALSLHAERWAQTLEEVVETVALALLAASVGVALLPRLAPAPPPPGLSTRSVAATATVDKPRVQPSART